MVAKAGVVRTVCYGQAQEWPSRKAAMDFFREGIFCSEGAERDRYVSIYLQLEDGAKEAVDIR